jgi:hypothetical protein
MGETSTERSRKHRASARDIEYPPPKNYRRRCRLEKDMGKWLKYYLPESFPLDWAEFHETAIHKQLISITEGGMFALALPRGSGKTTLCRGAAIYAMFRGLRRYVLLVGATGKKAELALNDIKTTLRFSDRLLEDYPEIIVPIRALEGVSLRCATQTAFGHPTNMTWNAKRIILPDTQRIDGKGMFHKNVASGCIIDIDGITGDIRGHVVTLPDGNVIRPDLSIVDDPQTRESAKSPEQTKDRINTIRGDVAGSVGPTTNIAIVIPCTVIYKNDAADQLLDREKNPDFRGERYGMIVSWPENMTIWDDYNATRLAGLENEDGGKSANEFYKNNREELERGAKVSWEERKGPNELTGLQHAMNLYFRLGEDAFYAEYQNEPRSIGTTIYDLEPDIIKASLYGLKPKIVPNGVHLLTCFVDINHYGLHWAVIGFDNKFAGYCTLYGRFPEGGELVPKNTTEGERGKLIRNGLDSLYSLLGGTVFQKENSERIELTSILVDRGYMPEVVHSFCKYARGRIRAIPSRGYAGHIYTVRKSSLVGIPRENCHMVESRIGPYLAYNSCYWREYAQKAWFGNVGEHGSLSLYGKSQLIHEEFAQQICNEKLVDKAVGDRGTIYRWAEAPNRWHDFGDCVTGCCVAAANTGMTTTGDVRAIFDGRRPRPVRKTK